MSENLYLVVGSAGWGEDYFEWPVAAYRDPKLAVKHATQAIEASELWVKEHIQIHGAPPQATICVPYAWSVLDRNMRADDQGTQYTVHKIPLYEDLPNRKPAQV